MSKRMQIAEVTEIYKTLDSTVQDKTWIDAHTEADVKLLTDARDVTLNLLSQVSIFIDLFHQYIDLVQSAAIFSPDFVQPDSNDANVSPTQTFPDVAAGSTANRADRRAKKTPFQVAKEKGQTK
jgi:hypothetical protein